LNSFECSGFAEELEEEGEPAAGACCARRGSVTTKSTTARQHHITTNFITRCAPLRWNIAVGDNRSSMGHYTHRRPALSPEIQIPAIYFSDSRSALVWHGNLHFRSLFRL